MYQLDEKLMADNRAIIAIASKVSSIDPNLKPGMHVFDSNLKDSYVVSSQQKYNRLIQEDAYTHKVHYDLNFAGNITIDKNLIVKGTSTNLETVDLLVSDNIIEINKDETGDGIGRNTSGIEINRGTRGKAKMLYSESTDFEKTGFLFGINEITLLSVYDDGDLKTLKDLYTQNAFIKKAMVIEGNSNIGGNITVGGTLVVNNTADFKSSVAVAGSTTLSGMLTVVGVSDLKSGLTVGGAAALNNNLTVKGESSLERTLQVTGNTTLRANLAVTGTSVFTGNITASANATIQNDLTVTRNASVGGTLTAADNTQLNKNLSVTGTSTLNGATTITGLLTTSNITNAELITTRNLNASNNISVAGDLTVTTLATFNGLTTINNNLAVNQNANVAGTLNVLGDVTLKSLIVNTQTLLKDVLTAQKLATFDMGILSKGASTFKENVVAEKNLSVTGTLTISGATAMQSLELSNTLTVLGKSTLSTLEVTSTSSFLNTLTAKTISLDTLRFKNAVGSVIEWNESGLNHQVYGSTSADTTYGYSLFDKAINDYNLTLKVQQGTTKKKGFVFVSDTTPLLHIGHDVVRTVNNIEVRRNSTWSPLLANADSHKANHSINGHDFLSPSDIGAVKNSKNTPELITDNESLRPAPSLLGRIFLAKDTKRIWQDLGNAWQIIGGQETIDWGQVTNKPATFTPPIATATTLGGVKIGSNLVVEADGTINVPKQTIEYTVHVNEFVATENQKVFTLNKSFLIGRNHVSPFLYGRRVPPSAYTETSDRTIEFKQGVPANALVEFYILLIPSDLSFTIKMEEFTVGTGQTRFVLNQGKYRPGTNKLKVYLNGALMPRSSFIETSSTEINFVSSPGVGNHVLIEYMYDPLV